MPFLRQHKALVCLALVSAGLSAMALGCVTAWIPEYLQRVQQMAPMQAGATIGSLLLLAAFVGQGGFAILVDWLAARGMRAAPVAIGLIPVALGIPVAWFAFQSGSSAAFVGWLTVLLICIAPCNAISNTVMQLIAPPALRSRLAALLILVISVIGFTLGPAIVGALSQYVLGEANLGTALQFVMAGAMALTLLTLLMLRPRLAAYLDANPVV